MKIRIILFLLLLAAGRMSAHISPTQSLPTAVAADTIVVNDDVDGAITICRAAIDMAESNGTYYTPENLDVWMKLAVLYMVELNMQEMRNCSKEALNILDRLKLKKELHTQKQIDIRTKLASAELAQGNRDGCREQLDIVVRLIDTEKDNDTIKAMQCADLVNLYQILGETAMAGDLIKKALAIYVAQGKDCSGYAHAMLSYAMYIDEDGSTYMAIKYAERAVSMLQKTEGEETYGYAMACNVLADLYASDKRYDEAAGYKQKYIDCLKQCGEKLDRLYIPVKDLIQYEYNAKHWDKIKPLLPQVIQAAIDDTKKNFLYLNAYERANYASGISNFLNFTVIKYAVALNDEALWGTVYDALLFSKGLLLNSGLSIERTVKESRNASWKERCSNLQQLRARLEKAQMSNDSKNIKLISAQLRAQESSLLSELADATDYTRRLSATWQQVQAALKDDEAAVEFCVSSDNSYVDLCYGALIVRKDQPRPQYVPLYKMFKYASDEVKKAQKDAVLQTWAKLSPWLAKVRHVYFSPTGDLHKYPIEYFAPEGMASVMFHRVSSTKELVYGRGNSNANVQKAVVYGGLNYNGTYASIDTANVKNDIPSSSAAVTRSRGVAGDASRGTYVTLSGARKEAGNIKAIMQAHNINAKWYAGVEGSEESFKALSGTNTQLVHIATHGFFWDDENMKDQQNKAIASDDVMTHSGLLLAGANRALRNEAIPDNMDDGVLTAREIASMDLSAVRLTVLSACETGLGDISGEGVFGLQRGLKNAGVQTVLMSLWKVHDEATQLLMTNFYQNLLDANTKGGMYGALLKAQDYLRHYDNGKYSAPSFWAAFILLDDSIAP